MRAVKFLLIAWLLGLLAMWIRNGRGFCVAEALPMVQRQQPFSPVYELQAVIALLTGVWGVWMLSRRAPRTAPQTTTGRRRFRSEIILIPLTVIALAAISQRIQPGISFESLIGNSPTSIQNVYLSILCLTIYAVVIAFKAFGKR